MNTTQQLTHPAAAIRTQLQELETERAMAQLNGLGDIPAYMDDLLAELEATRAAYVGAAVTEIASLRGALSGRLAG